MKVKEGEKMNIEQSIEILHLAFLNNSASSYKNQQTKGILFNSVSAQFTKVLNFHFLASLGNGAYLVLSGGTLDTYCINMNNHPIATSRFRKIINIEQLTNQKPSDID